MKIFLSYASSDRQAAEAIAFSLRGADHDVFFDRHNLPPGATFDTLIARELDEADLFVFLVSPEAVRQGRYTLTELALARGKWPNPNRRVLPVMVTKTDYASIPAYLKAATVLEPEGNPAAEVTAAIEKNYGRPNARVAVSTMAGLGLLSGGISGLALGRLLGGKHNLSDIPKIIGNAPSALDAAIGIASTLATPVLLGLALGFGLWKWAGRRWMSFVIAVLCTTIGTALVFVILQAQTFRIADEHASVLFLYRYAILGLVMALASSTALAIASPKFRSVELVALVVVVGTIAGAMVMNFLIFASTGRLAGVKGSMPLLLPFLLAGWHSIICAAAGYVFSREPRPA